MPSSRILSRAAVQWSRSVVLGGLVCCVFFAARPAHATPLIDKEGTDYVSSGSLIGNELTAPGYWSFGAEVTWVHHPAVPLVRAQGDREQKYIASDSGYGAFLQVQGVDRFTKARVGLGGQANAGILGLELGADVLTGGTDHATTGLLHLAPFVSLAYTSLAIRLDVSTIALSGARPKYGTQVGLLWTVKLPYRVR